ncbi:hypothetical protein CEXT_621611 [Caerostris extrusa]|uniref:Uncharacterized protein n=1 Tax=Caerostris extrusa TaxID=172846 RepID=A0AAV4X9H7_CAEEX|nr:hypothetical protein CEXT_621611 [Caerostris extrusa]
MCLQNLVWPMCLQNLVWPMCLQNLSVASVFAELTGASVFAELMEASAITEPSVVNVSIEPRVANVSAEPSVASVSLEPSMNNVSAEPSVANVRFEPSVTSVSAEPGVTNAFTEPSESINPYITEDFIEYNVIDKFDSVKLKVAPERCAEPENIGMIKQNAVILESNNSDEELSESLLKSIPKSTSTPKNVNIDEFYSRPSTSQQADYMEMLLAASHPGDTLDKRKRGSYCKFSHESFAKHSMDNSKYVPASKIIVENTTNPN